MVKHDSRQSRVKFYNGRGAALAKDPHANEHRTERKVLLIEVCVHIRSVVPIKIPQHLGHIGALRTVN